MFVITRFFLNLDRGSFSYCLKSCYYWSKKKKNSSLDRGLRYGGNIHFHINSIFVGIRIFQHLNSELLHSPFRSHQSDATVVSVETPVHKTALSPRLLRFQTGKAM